MKEKIYLYMLTLSPKGVFISQRIFEKIQTNVIGIIRGLEEDDSWIKTWSKNLVALCL